MWPTPNGPAAGTAFFGGPKETGPFNGLQAEFARISYAHVGPVRLPDNVSDEQAILLSDIFPTGYFGAKLAEIRSGDTVAVFGCGPVGLFSILSATLLGAGRVLAVDTVPSRLEMARALGAEVIGYNAEDPVETIKRLTNKIGVDRAIDAVGVDANRPHDGPAAAKSAALAKEFEEERKQIAPKTNPRGDNWHPGDAPSQVLLWAMELSDQFHWQISGPEGGKSASGKREEVPLCRRLCGAPHRIAFPSSHAHRSIRSRITHRA